MDIPGLTRDAFILLSTAAALQQVGRVADAIATAERARLRLTDAVQAVDVLLAEMRADLTSPVDPPDIPTYVNE